MEILTGTPPPFTDVFAKFSNCNKSSTTTFAGSEIQPSEYAHPLYHDLKFEYITEN